MKDRLYNSSRGGFSGEYDKSVPSREHDLPEGGYGYGYSSYDGFPPDEGSTSFMNYWRALVYRKWIVLGVFLVIFAIGVMQTRKVKPLYVSEATVEVQKIMPSSTNLNDLFSLFGQFDVYFQTQVLALKDRRTAEAYLVRAKQLSAEPLAKEEAKSSESAGGSAAADAKDVKNGTAPAETPLQDERYRASMINSLLGRLNVSTVPGTQLINVSLTDSGPELAQQTLRGYLQTYIQLDQEKRAEIAKGLKSILRAELDEAEKQLKKSEQELQDFTAKNGLVTSNRTVDQFVPFLDRASQQFIQSRDKRLQLEAMEQLKEAFLPSQTQDQYLQTLRAQLAQLKSEYASMETLYSPDYFKVVLLRTRIQTLENTIADLEKSSLSSRLDAAKQTEALASESYERTKKEALERSPVAAQYEILKKVMEANGQMYVALLQKYKTAMLDQGITGNSVSMFSAPTLPLGPLQTSKYRLMAIAAMLGLLGGIAVALALEKLDSRVRTTDELERAIRAPILGIVPKTQLAHRRSHKSDSPDAMIEFMPFLVPLSQVADSLRIVENAAESLLPSDSSPVICVSSALPLEGKTFISVSMGTVVACENKRVLVIDGDMRRPRVQKLFENKNQGPGLADLLSGDCDDCMQAIRRSHVPGLYYMAAGTIPDNPVALLKNGKIQEICEECKKSFDMVIVDAPPFMGMADASILARNADGLIMVTRQGHTPMEVLRRTYDSISVGRVKLLGIVLNMVYRDSGQYDYYVSKYSYRYSRKNVA